MAISYLSNIDLNNNELKSFIVDNLAAVPTVNAADQGNLIYNTALGALQYNTSNNTWVTISSGMITWVLVGDSGTSQTIGDGQSASILGEGGFISTTAAVTRQLQITMDDQIAAGTVAYPASITYNQKGQIKSVTGSTEPITGFDIEGDGANSQTISNGLTIDFTTDSVKGIDVIASSVSATKKQIKIALDLPELTDMTEVWLGTDEFIVLDNSVHGGETQKRKASSEIPLNILGNPTGDLNINNKKITNLLAGTGNLDAVNLQQLNAAVVGSLTIKGGFNANTGAIDGGGNLTTGAARVAIAVGDFYVVTTDGNFFANALTPLTVGDQVICNTGAAAGASVEGDFVIVQSDTDIATATTVGLASFPTAGGLSVVANGAVSLDVQGGLTANTYGDANTVGQFVVDGKGIITGAANIDIAIPSTQVTNFCTAVEACVGSGLNYAANIGDGSATTYSVTHALGTRDVIVQVYDNTTYDTVICDVVRTSTTVVTLSTTTALAANAARVLITVS